MIISKSSKALCSSIIAAGIVICSAQSSTAGNPKYACKIAGVITKIWMGYPFPDNDMFGITIQDSTNKDNSVNFSTQGVFSVRDNSAARSLLSIVLSAYATQSVITPTVTEAGTCESHVSVYSGIIFHDDMNGMIVGVSP